MLKVRVLVVLLTFFWGVENLFADEIIATLYNGDNLTVQLVVTTKSDLCDNPNKQHRFEYKYTGSYIGDKQNLNWSMLVVACNGDRQRIKQSVPTSNFQSEGNDLVVQNMDYTFRALAIINAVEPGSARFTNTPDKGIETLVKAGGGNLTTTQQSTNTNSYQSNNSKKSSSVNNTNNANATVSSNKSDFTDPITGMEFIWVEGGYFTMGCTSEQGNDCEPDEKPAHIVFVDGFYIGKFEVTQSQWKKVMRNNPSGFKGDYFPVENVSWNEVQKFLAALSQKTNKEFRLPTEAEWEYAARGGINTKGYKYSGGNDLNTNTWNILNSFNKTHKVGMKMPNELGIYDMSGNVSEWCSDWYNGVYYLNSTTKNPQGPQGNQFKVSRGGHFNCNTCCRVSYRINLPKNGTNFYEVGLRVVYKPY